MPAVRRPPGPSSVWKSIPNLVGVRRDPLGYFTRVAREHGDVALLRVGPARICLLSDPALLHEILVAQNRNFIKSRGLQRARMLLGNGLLTSEGDFWLRQRRLAQPAFHRDRIAAYGRTMVERAVRVADSWREGVELDAHREMMRLTLEIAGKTLFDVEVLDEAEDIGAALTAALDVFDRMTLPFGELLDRLPLPSNRRFHQAKNRLDQIIYGIIRERRATGEDTGDLLSMLLLAQDELGDGAGMTDEQVRDEVLTLFLAGHETTANALAWTWYLLAQHPDAESRLRAELTEVLAGRAPDPEDLPRLRYTRAVLAESMRLYPPAWIIGRQALDDFEVGGFHLPRGSIVFMSQWVVHRDTRYFPEPERFDPGRWTPEMEKALPRHAYFPFGGGPRKCIGESFAWMEGVLVLAALAARWRLELVPGQRVRATPTVTLRPRPGIRMIPRSAGEAA